MFLFTTKTNNINKSYKRNGYFKELNRSLFPCKRQGCKISRLSYGPEPIPKKKEKKNKVTENLIIIWQF